MTKTEVTLIIKYLHPLMRIKWVDCGSAFNFDTNTIEIDMNEINSKNDYGFMRHLRNVHKCKWANKINVGIWSILHEIGHYHTYNDIEVDENEIVIRETLNLVDTQALTHDESVQDIYFNLESEWVATEWAIDFLKNHRIYRKIFERMD